MSRRVQHMGVVREEVRTGRCAKTCAYLQYTGLVKATVTLPKISTVKLHHYSGFELTNAVNFYLSRYRIFDPVKLKDLIAFCAVRRSALEDELGVVEAAVQTKLGNLPKTTVTHLK